jgi:competence protein ComEC
MIEITVFYVTIFLILRYIDEKRNAKNDSVLHRLTVIKYLLIAAALYFAADISYLTFRDKFSSELKITIIDVGQGNSSWVQFPGGTNMLIDGGGFAKSSFDVGKGVVAPFLYYQRIKNIEPVVLSHPHPDHLMGLIYILNSFNVRNVWKTNLPVSLDFFPDWERAIKMNHINLSILSNNSAEKVFNGVKVKVLWPADDYLKNIRNFSYDAENDSSLVLKITYGNVSFLFPGDISSEIEKKLIKAGADLKSDVLVVPHHGSNKSSSIDFIKTVGCRYAVVSSGKSNVFKHPHPSVLERYEEAGAEIFRTDQHGAITFATDGNKLHVDTFIKNK